MQKIHFSVFIDAPKEKVWHTMLDDEPYRKWTEAFAKGSHYVGNWSKGSKILFLAPDDQGKMGGMVGRIRENKRYEFVSIEHMGIVQDGVEDTTSEEVKKWAPALENYTFTEKDGGTEVAIEMDVLDEHRAMFDEMWPNALRALKELAQQE